MKILVTGAAGFIGFHLVRRLCHFGHEIVGLDNISDYYDVQLKYDRLKQTGISQSAIEYNHLGQSLNLPNYRFIKLSLEDGKSLGSLFNKEQFDGVCHLAAQAGVRYSIENPLANINSNIVGFINLLESCRYFPVRHLVYASSSSVYGLNGNYPDRVSDGCDHPVSLYAATKKSNELMAHAYSYLFKIPTTGLRFFTVYGPWGRPDMSPMLFARAIVTGEPIKVFNNGKMQRDFTYIDDVINGVIKVLEKPAQPSKTWQTNGLNPAESSAPYKIYNIGNSHPIELMTYIQTIEKAFGKVTTKVFCPMQPGDVLNTFSDTAELKRDFGYCPNTPIEEGVEKFVAWFKDYYSL